MAFRSGTEEEYGELHQLLESITSYRRDFAELKNKEKELKKKKEEDDRKRAETMKIAAMQRMASKCIYCHKYTWQIPGLIFQRIFWWT